MRAQEDCGEFLGFLLDRLEEDAAATERLPGARDVGRAVFQGRMVGCVVCGGCGGRSVREEGLSALMLAVVRGGAGGGGAGSAGGRGGAAAGTGDSWGWWLASKVLPEHWAVAVAHRPVATSLEACLAAHTAPSRMEGYQCDGCGEVCPATVQQRIRTEPEVAVFLLKRFAMAGSRATKDASGVRFPLRGLDLGPSLENPPPTPVLYDLVALVRHTGSARSGHYDAFVRGGLGSGWWRYDDHRVSSVGPEEVAAALGAYMLFYRRRRAPVVAPPPPPPGGDLRNRLVSRRWVELWKHCSRPGPIDNRDFACPHGKVRPGLGVAAQQLADQVEPHWWASMVQEHGGGPEVIGPDSCQLCATGGEETESEGEFGFSSSAEGSDAEGGEFDVATGALQLEGDAHE